MRASCFTPAMSTHRLRLESQRAATTVRRRLAEDLQRQCDDAGITPSVLARATGLNRSFVARIIEGRARPTIETYARLAAGLGSDLSARLYPNTGPVIRDRHQARILEGLLEQLDPRWRPITEVAVRRPARGWIDVVLHDVRAQLVVATEIQSELRRLEQLVRWSEEKAAALPSWSGWASVNGEPDVSRLLLVRRTRVARATAREFARQLTIAYPAHPDDAIAALTGSGPWPGPAMVWVRDGADGVSFVAGR